MQSSAASSVVARGTPKVQLREKKLYHSNRPLASRTAAVAQVQSNATTSHATTSSATTSASIPTIVMQVRGEMGNHLQKIAHGYGLHWHANEHFSQLNTELRLRHLKKPKWKTARADIYQCFPKLQQLDYEGGHSPDFVQQQNAQSAWLASQSSTQQQELVQTMYQIRDETLTNISNGLGTMQELSRRPDRPPNSKYFPIVILGGPMRNVLVDAYYDQYRDLFAFDSTAKQNDECCAQLPGPNETVFHFRHFAKELSSEEQRSRGFEELDPNRVATLLMGHLPKGAKVAMTSRFADDPLVQDYVQAIGERGLQVRLVTNQTGVQDFCFLLQAQQELIGVAKSTYARWAAYLGQATKVQLYALDNPGSQEFIQQTMKYPWKHAEIQRRIQWPVFPTL